MSTAVLSKYVSNYVGKCVTWSLNGRGLATDSEINVSTTDSGAARELRLRLWAEHLTCAEDDLRHACLNAILDGR